MAWLYYVSVWLHILSAIVWIGGMFFLVLVVVPWMRRGHREEGAALLRDTGPSFSRIGWICFAVLLTTGSFNLYVRGVRFPSFVDPIWLASSFGRSVLVKLGLFAAVLAISAVHDFVHGPRALAAIARDPTSDEAEAARRRASVFGRLNAVLALALLGVGVALVRGWPW